MGEPRFYFTLHRGDLIRERMPAGRAFLLVASGAWSGRRLGVGRPPRGQAGRLALDSGGFTAARRWGEYPWSPAEYAAWARQVAERDSLDFVAVMDYACEWGVNREVHVTNRQRIRATVENTLRCLDADPGLPWLPVVQGYTVAEYLWCADLLACRGITLDFAGLGTVCGRPARTAAALMNELRVFLPHVRWHAFGLDLRTLQDGGVQSILQSWDSYAWNWGKGSRNDSCRLRRAEGESYSSYCGRLALDYEARVLRLTGRPRQGLLF